MNQLIESWLKELNAEIPATEKCLERIPENKWEFKPHPTSMPLGYLALLVAEIPRWITIMLEEGEIDFASFSHAKPRTNAELMDFFHDNVKGLRKALEKASPADIHKTFYLKANGKELFHETNEAYVGPTLNHWVHHRGQLTVYMRMCEIPVPSIYGPSADDNPYK